MKHFIKRLFRRSKGEILLPMKWKKYEPTLAERIETALSELEESGK